MWPHIHLFFLKPFIVVFILFLSPSDSARTFAQRMSFNDVALIVKNGDVRVGYILHYSVVPLCFAILCVPLPLDAFVYSWMIRHVHCFVLLLLLLLHRLLLLLFIWGLPSLPLLLLLPLPLALVVTFDRFVVVVHNFIIFGRLEKHSVDNTVPP